MGGDFVLDLLLRDIFDKTSGFLRVATSNLSISSLSLQILLSFHLSVPSSEDIKTMCTLILQPETPPKITFSKL